MEFVHKSIMLEEVIESLAIKPNGIYVDGTLGGAGHSSEIVKRLGEDGRLIGIDQDGEAIEAATKRLKPYKDKVTIVRSNYAQMKEVLRDLGIHKVDGILLDLGVSSYQLDNAERGFTYREDVPLDMRMDQRQTKTAKDIVNDYSEMELYHIIRNYGEDKFAKNIAKHIVQARQKAPIETTGQLIEVIKAAIPKKVRATDLGIHKVDGILLDLGVSSYQLDNAERGFTYREDVPLDMRMDQRQTKTAKDIVNDYSEMELYHIIRNYGEDKFAKNIAKHIVQARQKAPIETTGQLIEVIKAAIPKKVRATGGHPAKKTFQAIRIELNHELDVLKNNLEDMIDLLNDEGRIAIITFHSLEDRIVKNIFRTSERPCICPPEFPVCVCGRVSKGKVITRKPIVPGKEELEENSRSKSAKLRVFERRITEG